MVDAALQRKNMVESQVRPSDVTDRRITRAMLKLPREEFVPHNLKAFAYMDEELLLKAEDESGAPRRALMAPRTFAKLLQLAEIDATDVVLDVGAATGYSSGVISTLCETVVALERDRQMAETASERLEAQGIDNVVVVTGELAAGYPDEGPFDVIVLEGSISKLADELLDQLKDGGRLVAIVNDGSVGHGVIWRRIGSAFDQRSAFEASAPALPGFDKPPGFEF